MNTTQSQGEGVSVLRKQELYSVNRQFKGEFTMKIIQNDRVNNQWVKLLQSTDELLGLIGLMEFCIDINILGWLMKY